MLTVSDPGESSGKKDYDGSPVLVMPRRSFNGNANQLWMYDRDSGFISAFATDSTNKGNTMKPKGNYLKIFGNSR